MESSTSITMSVIGARFDSVVNLRNDIDDWVITKGLSHSVARNNKGRLILVCRKSAICTFKLSVYSRSEYWEITSYVPHICPRTTHQNWRVAKGAKRLAGHHHGLNASFPNTQPKHLVTEERL